MHSLQRCKITDRAVLYPQCKCNVKCIFCYFAYYPINKFPDIEKLKHQAFLAKNKYKCNKIEYCSTGEMSIYPDLYKLNEYCRSIGLLPSLITNGLIYANENRVKEVINSGLEHFLVSVHGIDNLSFIMGTPAIDYFKFLDKAIDNMQKHTQFYNRSNTVLIKYNYKQLPKLAKYFIKKKIKINNFISFNPFYEWVNMQYIDCQERHSIIAPYLKEAIDILEEAGHEVNVRYFPFCMLKGYEKNQYNFQQLPYDPGEWFPPQWHSVDTDISSQKLNVDMSKDVESLSNRIMRNIANNIYVKTNKCKVCSLNNICDGLTKQYFSRFGDDELEPYEGEIVNEPTHFIKNRYKYLWEVNYATQNTL